jgi:hypothetical protein
MFLFFSLFMGLNWTENERAKLQAFSVIRKE